MATAKKKKRQEKDSNKATATDSIKEVEILNHAEQVLSTNEKNITLLSLFSKAKGMFEKDSRFLITGLLLFLSFAFYPLGYSILYGYYFCKDASEIKLMDIFLGQIPFSFKFIVVMGVSSLAFILFFYISIHLFFIVDTITEKLTFFFFHLMTIFLIYLAMDILGGLRNTRSGNNVIIGLLSLSCILWVFLFIMKSFIFAINSAFILVRNTFIFILWSISVFMIYTKIPSSFYTIPFVDIIIYSFVILVIMFLDYSMFNNDFKLYKHKIVLFCILRYALPLVVFWITSNKKAFGLIIAIILAICFWEYYHLYAKTPENKKGEVESVDATASKPRKKPKKTILVSIIFPFLAVMSIIAYLIICYIMSLFGIATGQTIVLSSTSLITYQNPRTSQYSEITGVVVARKGDTLYISSEDRQLIIITSSNIIIEPKQL